MNETPGLRIIFGTTGHRDIPAEAVPAIEEAVRKLFADFKSRYPNTALVLLSPLAVGADRIVARVALSQGIELRVPMPLEESEYRKDFDAAEDAEFDRILALAKEKYAIEFVAGNDATNVHEPERRAAQYQRVGEYIARLSHVLIALWDGQPATSVGGTASIVSYRLYGSEVIPNDPKELLDVPPRGAVYHISTPRLSQPSPSASAGTLVVRTRKKRLDPEDDPFCPLYARIERFNKDVREIAPDVGRDYSVPGMRTIAEMLANTYQRRYTLTLNCLFSFATFAAIFLALAHGDPPFVPLVIAYIVLLLFSYMTFFFADGSDLKARSIEYRALEMGLSIQLLWDRIGHAESAANAYLRIQWSECDWIRQAVQSIHYLARKVPVDVATGIDIARDFIEGQRTFFAHAHIRDGQKAKVFKYLAATFVVIGNILTFILTFNLDASHVIDVSLFGYWHPAKHFGIANLCIRGIIICTILVASLHEYSRRRAFEAQSRRYSAMRPIYGRAIELIEAASALQPIKSLQVARDVAEQIGKEALAENGEWLLMHRDLPLDPVHV